MKALSFLKAKFFSTWYILKGIAKPSFSQVGEDKILLYLFQSISISNPVYLDIGANHPVNGNNTYLFYLRGCKGVCVEPNPGLASLFAGLRRRDLILNIGIGLDTSREADYYLFSPGYSGWNTFDKETAEYRNKHHQQYEKVLKMPLRNINEIIKENFSAPPDLISIDVEGLDEEIIFSLDFEKNGPTVLLVETIVDGDTSKAKKQQALIEYICKKGYIVFADTFVNTIFCKKDMIRQ